jgi:hypothetical protein
MKRLLEGLLREALTAAVGAGDLAVEVPERIQLDEPSDLPSATSPATWR